MSILIILNFIPIIYLIAMILKFSKSNNFSINIFVINIINISIFNIKNFDINTIINIYYINNFNINILAKVFLVLAILIIVFK